MGRVEPHRIPRIPRAPAASHDDAAGRAGRAPERSRRHRGRRVWRALRRHPWLAGTGAVLAALLLAAWITGLAFAEPLRREAERRMNAALVGYRVSIGALRLNLLGLGVDLLDLRVVQASHPDPPVADVGRFGASIQWRALLHGRVVGDLVIVEPKLFLNLDQAKAEARDERDVDEHGWQDAVRSVYPLEINALEVRRGSITYDDGSDIAPIHATDAQLLARDIRNVASRPGDFPSPLRFEATVFESGRARFDGAADFLAEPRAAVRGDLALDEVPLKPLTPIASPWGVRVKGGALSADGSVTATPASTSVALAHVRIDSLRADLATGGAAGDRGARVAAQAARGATDPGSAPQTAVRIDELRLVNGELGWIDRDADPDYRVFVSQLDVAVRGFTNAKPPAAAERRAAAADAKGEGATGRADVGGAFMGSGRLRLHATFQPTDARTEFASDLEITDVDLTTMNDLLRARGGFDVRAGRFSLFSEIDVRDGRVDGYVKPIFSGLDVYDRRQDADKNIFQQAYEGVVGGIGTLLENRPRDEVATRTDLSGRIESPETSTWEIVVGLVQNAFVRAIVPGLDREAGRE